MKYKIIVRPEAEDDLTDAFNWYENNRSGLGYDFLLQVDAGLNFIIRNPHSHPDGYAGTKKHLLKRFPYKIIYIVNEDKVVIVGVLHGRRNLDLIQERITGK